jgi:hypothetical protein
VALGQADVNVDLDFNGAPKANLEGCGMMSNEAMVCSGNARRVAGFADSPTGDSSPCGQVAHNMPTPKLEDPYAKLATHIPPNRCTGYSTTTITAPPSGEVTYCGTLKLGANLIDVTQPTTIVIMNGNLDLNGNTLKGSNLTIIFGGNNGTAGTSSKAKVL